MDKIEQKLGNRMNRLRSESGERARHAEIADDPHNGSQSRPLDMKGLLERNRELDRQSTNMDSDNAVRHNRESGPHRAEAMEHGKSPVAGFVDRLNKERASGELALKSEAHVKKQVDGMRLDREHVNGLLERQRIMDQQKV